MRLSLLIFMHYAFVISLLLVGCCSISLPKDGDCRKALVQNIHFDSPPSPASFHSVSRRALNLRLVQFDQGFIAPIENARPAIAHFYTQVMLSSMGPWSTMKPRIWIRMTLGSLSLAMTATGGNTIPWEFVSSFAYEFLGFVNHGYVSTFEAFYTNPEGSAGIFVSFACGTAKILGTAAAVAASSNENTGKPLDPNAALFHLPPGIL